MRLFLVMVTLAAFAFGGKGMAHEFWIDAAEYVVAPGEIVEADLRTGTDFRGTTQSYLPRNFDHFEVISGEAVRPVEGRLGDIPALSMADLPEGLAVVVHQTAEQRLTWSSWERFMGFVAHKDLGDIATAQADRGLDQEDVREGYIRFAKALVAVGEGAGQDIRTGMRTELVALANPYTDTLGGALPVQLWLDDAPVANWQVELFAEASDGTVTITTHRTGADGVVRLPVQSGHVYMADAVSIEPVDPLQEGDPEWRSLWANLTFAVP